MNYIEFVVKAFNEGYDTGAKDQLHGNRGPTNMMFQYSNTARELDILASTQQLPWTKLAEKDAEIETLRRNEAYLIAVITRAVAADKRYGWFWPLRAARRLRRMLVLRRALEDVSNG